MISNQNCFIIGGGEIYKQSMEIADQIYLTLVHEDFEGDTTFPEIGSEWKMVTSQDFEPDEKNKHKYSFIEYMKFGF